MRLRRPRQHVPTLWELFAKYFGLPAPLSRAWWTALERAQWSEARAFYQAVSFFDMRPGLTPDTVMTFVQQTASPKVLLDLLEALMQERRLSRAKGALLEEAVLARVTSEGQWK